jgi:hypothetical protein
LKKLLHSIPLTNAVHVRDFVLGYRREIQMNLKIEKESSLIRVLMERGRGEKRSSFVPINLLPIKTELIVRARS